MKKPFTIENWEADKTQKVVTRDGHDVRVLCTDAKRDDYPVVALVNIGGLDFPRNFTPGGRFLGDKNDSLNDLFIITNDETEN